MDAQRELLDQLMGKNRNLCKDDAPLREQHWNDPDICPYYISSFCPNDLFINTKSDLGQCEYEHVYELKSEYEKEPRRIKRRVEKKLLYYLYDLIKDVDRRIRRGKDRISLNAPSTDKNHSFTNIHNQLMTHYKKSKIDSDTPKNGKETNGKTKPDEPSNDSINKQLEQKKKDINLRCEQLDFEINKLNDHIDILCNEGKIDDAEVLLKQVDTLEKEKQHLKNMDLEKLSNINNDLLNGLNGIKNKEKNRFEICEICGVFQAIDDAEDRIARHFDGKQHKGYDTIRKKIKELEALHKKEEQQERNERRNRSRHSRDSSSRRRYDRDGKNRDRNDRRDRDGKDRRRDKDRKRDKDRNRDRDRKRGRDERKRRSRSRDRERRRDRDRDREKKKR